jgi:ribose-phosphate pyrophosphokinase
VTAPLLFALPPSKALARATGLSLAPFELRRFEDGEQKIRPLVSVRGGDVYVMCSLHGNASETVHDRLCRLLFFAGALHDAGAGRITVIAPYLCYSRKDRRTNPRDPVTTRYVARMIESAGVDRIVTVDVHNRAAFENAFRIPTEHLEANPLFAARCRTLGPRLAIVSPDPGGFHRAEALRDMLETATSQPLELAMLGKHRKAGVVRSEAFVGDVEGRVAVIVDDMIVTGTTLARAAEACRLRGATSVHALATHAMFGASAVGVLRTSLLDSITVTDSVMGDRVDLTNLSVVSIAPLLGRAISVLHEDRSITPLIADQEARAR